MTKRNSIGSVFGQALNLVSQTFNAAESLGNVVERSANQMDLANEDWAEMAQFNREQANKEAKAEILRLSQANPKPRAKPKAKS